jgi:hypothetical protein
MLHNGESTIALPNGASTERKNAIVLDLPEYVSLF